MAGKAKHASKLAQHLGTPVDAACRINRPGATATVAVAGVVGMAAAAAVKRGPKGDEIKVQRNGWLAVGPHTFSLVDGDKLLGNPKGDPYAVLRYDDVAAVEIKPGVLTTRAKIALGDGRTVVFETNRKGANKTNPDVLALLAERCGDLTRRARA